MAMIVVSPTRRRDIQQSAKTILGCQFQFRQGWTWKVVITWDAASVVGGRLLAVLGARELFCSKAVIVDCCDQSPIRRKNMSASSSCARAGIAIRTVQNDPK
jgi:hypothetical protein